MRRTRFLARQILILVMATICLCFMLLPSFSFVTVEEAEGETPKPFTVFMNLIIEQKDKDLLTDEYVARIGNDKAAEEWKELSFFDLAGYTWDAGFWFDDQADEAKAQAKEINADSMLGSKVQSRLLTLAAACRFANIVAICISILIYTTILGLVAGIIYSIVELLLCLFSKKLADAFASTDEEVKGGNFNPIGVFAGGYCTLLLIHHLFSFTLQGVYEAMYDRDLSVSYDLVFTGGLHWLLVIILGGILLAVGKAIINAVFKPRAVPATPAASAVVNPPVESAPTEDTPSETEANQE